MFVEGLCDFVDKRENRVRGDQNAIRSKQIEADEDGEGPVVIGIQPEEICQLGKKLGVSMQRMKGWSLGEFGKLSYWRTRGRTMVH